MQIQIVGKGLDVSQALHQRIAERVTEGVQKYSDRPGESWITVSRDGRDFRVDCSLHLPSGVLLQTRGEAGDAYDACDNAMEKLEKRLRRYKRKMKNHHHHHRPDPLTENTSIYILKGQETSSGQEQTDEEEYEEDDTPPQDPVVIAEQPGELRTLTVSMAVQEMELTDAAVVVFRNAAHGAVNVVFRRPDGHFGWIDPERRPEHQA